MKTGLISGWLLIFGVWVLAQTVTVGGPPDSFVVDGERALLIKGKIAGETKVRLVVEAHNGWQWKSDGYNPCLTASCATISRSSAN
jgi:hypothetical protein